MRACTCASVLFLLVPTTTKLQKRMPHLIDTFAQCRPKRGHKKGSNQMPNAESSPKKGICRNCFLAIARWTWLGRPAWVCSKIRYSFSSYRVVAAPNKWPEKLGKNSPAACLFPTCRNHSVAKLHGPGVRWAGCQLQAPNAASAKRWVQHNNSDGQVCETQLLHHELG